MGQFLFPCVRVQANGEVLALQVVKPEKPNHDISGGTGDNEDHEPITKRSEKPEFSNVSLSEPSPEALWTDPPFLYGKDLDLFFMIK